MLKLSFMGNFYITLIAANFEKIVEKDLRINRVLGEISLLLLLWLILRELGKTECKGSIVSWDISVLLLLWNILMGLQKKDCRKTQYHGRFLYSSYCSQF